MSKYYEWRKDGNKMIIHSDFKEFNKQTNCISEGNAISNTQYSNYIRPYNETINPVGEKVQEGHLFNYDLKYFNISNSYREYIKSLNMPVILYEFFIYRNGEKDIIGWLIEDAKEQIIIDFSVNCEYKTHYLKRFSALKTARNIIEEVIERRKSKCMK